MKLKYSWIKTPQTLFYTIDDAIATQMILASLLTFFCILSIFVPFAFHNISTFFIQNYIKCIITLDNGSEWNGANARHCIAYFITVLEVI
jgi:hypothetical protein